MIKRTAIIILSMSLIMSACKKKSATPEDKGYSYSDYQVGSYVIYDVDSTFYDDFFVPTKVITTKFRLKEKVASFYYDNQNRLTARIERYIKPYDSNTPYDSIPWQLKNVWAANNTNDRNERIEENVRFVKLHFPIYKNKVWDENIHNVNSEKNLTFKQVDYSDSIGTILFDSLVQTEFDDGGQILTQRNYSTEKYAKNIGLVYKQEINVTSQPDPNATTSELQIFYGQSILDRITSGYQYTWTVNSYGKE